MCEQADNNMQGHHVKLLLEYVLKHNYKVQDNDIETERILNNCINLFRKDYRFSIVDNRNGELCSHYPPKIIIPEYMKPECKADDKYEDLYDTTQLRDIIKGARFARCRSRFTVPVILCEGKYICRGATISGGPEMYGRQMFDMLLSGGDAATTTDEATETTEWQMFDRIRGLDIKLLKMFQVSYICDLMVEKKKVKFGFNVTSSEKVDKENRYSDFSILSVPYPGCEFFKEWKDSGYSSEIVFDWSQGFVDTKLDLRGRLSPPQSVDWHKYQNWSITQLTQNYLKLLLHYIKESDSGLLVHCISGWDRTPLFISLLRLSLWAEGLIHTSLSPAEILYLTIGYDWFLFGHNFPDRLRKGEEIFYFGLNFLKHITGEEFNIGHKSSTTRYED